MKKIIMPSQPFANKAIGGGLLNKAQESKVNGDISIGGII